MAKGGFVRLKVIASAGGKVTSTFSCVRGGIGHGTVLLHIATGEYKSDSQRSYDSRSEAYASRTRSAALGSTAMTRAIAVSRRVAISVSLSQSSINLAVASLDCDLFV